MRRRSETAAGRMRGKGVRARIGALMSVELLFILPILLLLVLAMVEFSMLIGAQTIIAAASREGARAAALGGSPTDVQNAVDNVLGSALSGNNQVTIQINYLNQTMTDPGTNPGEPVQVIVSVPANLLVSNLLVGIGIDLSQVTLSAQTTMTIE